MYEVHWVNHFNHVDKVHGTFKTLDEAKESVHAWWKAHNFTPYNIKEWTKDDGTLVWGFGAQNCFYHFKKVK